MMIALRRTALTLLITTQFVPAGMAAGDKEAPAMSSRLYRVILPVTDIDRAAAFYSGLLQKDGERVSPGRHYFDLGGTILAIYDPGAEGDEAAAWRHHPKQYIYIGVDDLEGAFERARSLGADLDGDGIASMPWGERLFYLHDPFGSPVCLVDMRTLFLGPRPAHEDRGR